MIDIYKLLKENKDIDAWCVRSETVESYELFFVHKRLETVRATDTENVNVTVYADREGKRGSASFKLFASTGADEAREKIASAAQKAALISNEFYELPSAETLDGRIESNFDLYSAKSLAEEIANTVFSADMLEFGSVNALEIFINKHKRSVKNSRGLDKREEKYSAMVEAIPTWNEGESVELYEAQRFNSLDKDKIKQDIEKEMREVSARGRAKKPDGELDCPVLLPKEELSALCRELVSGLGFSSVYSHSNPFSEGDKLQSSPKGDKISITMRAVIEGSAASSLFDDDGVSLVDTEVIKDGAVSSYFGGSRFAQYLGRVPTGALSCMELSLGTLDDEALNSQPYFEIVSMSGLQADVYNDYIGGEVRLAYYFDGKERHPVTGISISGKLSECLNTVRLSNRVGSVGRYRGPEYALFSGLKIV